MLSQLADTVRTARDGLSDYDATGAGRRIQRFVDDLSNWYVRRARRRFWNQGGTTDPDTAAAFATLYECLVTTATLLAPFTPFVADELWRTLAAGRGDRPASVHLADYPEPDATMQQPELDAAMDAAREIVELGRRVRVDAKIRTRQPLAEAVLHYPGDHDAITPMFELIADELNVQRVAFVESEQQFGSWRAKPNFKALGPRLGPAVKQVAAALEGDDETAALLARGEHVTVHTDDGPVDLSPDDVDLHQETASGWGVATDGGLTVALELELTDALRSEGLARELVRVVQDARKAADLQVSDRIELGVQAGPALDEMLRDHGEIVARETLATSVQREAVADGFRQEAEVDGIPVLVTLRRV